MLALVSNEHNFFSGSGDGHIRVWNANDSNQFQCVSTILAHTGIFKTSDSEGKMECFFTLFLGGVTSLAVDEANLYAG